MAAYANPRMAAVLKQALRQRPALSKVLVAVLLVGLALVASIACPLSPSWVHGRLSWSDAHLAWADDSLVAGEVAGNARSASQEPSLTAQDATYNDVEDHGWIYREGDFWYRKPVNGKPPTPEFVMVDGRAYHCYSDKQPYHVLFDHLVAMYYRETDELVYQAGTYYDMQRVIASGNDAWLQVRFDCDVIFEPYVYQYTDLGNSVGTGGLFLYETVSHMADTYRYVYEDSLDSHAFVPRKIVFDDDFEQLVEQQQRDDDSYLHPEDWFYRSMCHRTWSNAFKGLANVEEIEGIGKLNLEVVGISQAFAGCEKLRELDLSGFDTRKCTNFEGMLDGCESLVRLTVGPSWTQVAVDDGAFARFPVAMARGEGASARVYQAGDIIPDGAATYTALASFNIAKASVQLLQPGALVVDEQTAAEYESGMRELPQGKTLDDLHIWHPGDADAQTGEPRYRYTGSPVRPTVAIELGGKLLREGVDYVLEYRDDVENGTAQVKISGRGDAYGVLYESYEIVDADAYAFLYDNGLLILKCDHNLPANWRLTSGVTLVKSMKWFEADDPAAGQVVAWASRAAQVRRVVFDDSFAQMKPTTVHGWFAGCSNLAAVEGWENVDMSAVSDASQLFAGCTKLVNASLQGFDDEGVTDFSGFFEGCTALETVAFGDCDFADAVNLRGLFKDCTSLPYAKLGRLDLSNVTDAQSLFEGCTSLMSVDCAGMSLDSATDASRMFAGCTKLELLDLNGLSLASARDASSLFAGCSSLFRLNMAGLQLPQAHDVSGMFSGCAKLERLNLENVKLPQATDVSRVFQGCKRLESIDVSGLGLPAIQNIDGFVSGCSALQTLNVGDLDLSGAFGASSLLDGCAGLTSFKMGAGWRNGQVAHGALPLKFASKTYRVSPSYVAYAEGAAIPDGVGEYRLRSIAMQFATVAMEKPSYDATGKAITPKVEVRLGSTKLVQGTDYTLSYANNLYPGKASITVKGKGAFAGGLVVPFTITAPVTAVGDRLVYKTKDAKFTFKVTKVEKQGGVLVVTAATLISVNVTNPKLTTLSLPSKCTIGGVSVTMTKVNNKLTGRFCNVSRVVIGANVTKIGAWAFCYAPTVKRLIVKSARLKKVTNCLAGSNINRVTTNVWLTSSQRSKYKKWFTKKAGKSGVKFVYG